MTRYSANATYYPQSLTILRLDRPSVTGIPDDEQRTLWSLLPVGERPLRPVNPIDVIQELTKAAQAARQTGDSQRAAELMSRIAVAATAVVSPSLEEEKNDETEGIHLEIDVQSSIRESLAFRSTVTTIDAMSVIDSEDSATALLADEIANTRSQLGIKDLMLVEDLPVITATFGYTRRSFLPTFEELSAQDLPTEIRAFPSLDKYAAAQRLGRPELVGTVPILAREGDHEGIFLSLDPARVAAWLRTNGIAVPQNEKSPLSWILSHLEPIDRYYDDIWSCRVRRMVFGLVHTLSHAAMRAASWYSGLERTSLSEYLFLPLLGTVIYDSSGSFQLGGFETLVRDQLSAFLDALANEALYCVYDSTCIDGRGACHGCIQSPEISCRTFNHGLSRTFLIGGHAPWADVSNFEQIVGFWQLDGVEY
ncbi:hypothetical protein [Marispirochaeta aestuarii]|nr:hypothetical protein [Marispirochaeta aestuarii]